MLRRGLPRFARRSPGGGPKNNKSRSRWPVRQKEKTTIEYLGLIWDCLVSLGVPRLGGASKWKKPICHAADKAKK